jgi:hypothetical protein
LSSDLVLSPEIDMSGSVASMSGFRFAMVGSGMCV